MLHHRTAELLYYILHMYILIYIVYIDITMCPDGDQYFLLEILVTVWKALASDGRFLVLKSLIMVINWLVVGFDLKFGPDTPLP